MPSPILEPGDKIHYMLAPIHAMVATACWPVGFIIVRISSTHHTFHVRRAGHVRSSAASIGQMNICQSRVMVAPHTAHTSCKATVTLSDAKRCDRTSPPTCNIAIGDGLLMAGLGQGGGTSSALTCFSATCMPPKLQAHV